jgi:hypothetical protein
MTHKSAKKSVHGSEVKTLEISVSICEGKRVEKSKEKQGSLRFLSCIKNTKCEANIPLLVLNISSKEFYISKNNILSKGAISYLPEIKSEIQQQVITEYIKNREEVNNYAKVQMLYNHLVFKKHLNLFLISGRMRMFMRRRAACRIVKAILKWLQRRKVKAKLIQKWYKKQIVKSCTKTEELPSSNEEIKITYNTKNYSSTRITSFKQTPKNIPHEVADNVIDERISSALEALSGEVESIISDQHSDYCADINEYPTNELHIINSVSVVFDSRDKCLSLSDWKN